MFTGFPIIQLHLWLRVRNHRTSSLQDWLILRACLWVCGNRARTLPKNHRTPLNLHRRYRSPPNRLQFPNARHQILSSNNQFRSEHSSLQIDWCLTSIECDYNWYRVDGDSHDNFLGYSAILPWREEDSIWALFLAFFLNNILGK